MQSTVEETEKHTVKLSVEVPPDEFGADLDRAYEYVLTLNGAGAPEGFVAFTASPAILARASLDRIEERGPGAKITRDEVASLMEAMFERLGRYQAPFPRNGA